MKQGKKVSNLNKMNFGGVSLPYNVRIYGFKALCGGKQHFYITPKLHHHNYYEVHFSLDGFVNYNIGNKNITLESGQYLIITPKIKHQATSFSDPLYRLTLLFGFEPQNVKNPVSDEFRKQDYWTGTISVQMKDAFDFIVREAAKNSLLSPHLIGNRVFELLCLLLRDMGINEAPVDTGANSETDIRLTIAKQYILDNVNFPIICTDVSSYCHLSYKQLNRLFLKNEGVSLLEFIHSAKISAAQELLRKTDYTIGQISEMLHFSNEYNFNSFFKKYSGVTPGDYRRALR